MRYLLAILLAVGLALGYVGFGTAQTARISLTATVESFHRDGLVETRYYLLWNKNERARPLGHALYSCSQVFEDAKQCSATHVLPLGKIVTQGSIHSYSEYTVVITGGTGHYVGAGGFLSVVRIGPGTVAMNFRLH